MNNNNLIGREIHKSYYTTGKGKGSWKGLMWSAPFHDFVFNKIKPTSLCDVGCGAGEFINLCYEKGVKECYGVDIITVELDILNPKNHNVTYIPSAASEIDLPDNSVDIVTSFEVLEHVHPEEVDAALQNLFRISNKYVCLSITHRLSGKASQNGDKLHLTVEPWGWWETKFNQYGSLVELMKPDPFPGQNNSCCIWEKK